MTFQDHFSRQAGDYGLYRPRYPAALAEYLAAAAPARALALDLATGNGQAAVDLAAHFALVLASDASAAQLAHAEPHPRIRYLRHRAEALPVAARCVDLVAVAQAAHWFDFERFYPEVRRVLRPGGVLALWTYEKFRIDPGIDAIVDHFYGAVVGRYWPPERRHVEAGYRTLPFPLDELAAPPFAIATRWDLPRTVHYLGTWSAVDRYRRAEGSDPLPALAEALTRVWPGGAERDVTFPVHLRLGRVGPI
ncbi:MAG: class I SAM-dependent methyltransferase [Proteobacteria bacterium]|nr:class I SAM-dependent methyltransferase [Pseudomonadota bacterium]